jgi:hypothetical protein
MRYLAVPLHHHGVARGREKVVIFLDDESVVSVIEVEFLDSLTQFPEHSKTVGLHALEHLHDAASTPVVLSSNFACEGSVLSPF